MRKTVSRGIIQTAVTKPATRLKLDYQVPTTVGGVAKTENEVARIASGIGDSGSSMTEEFACLLNVLRNGEPS
jgi:hypothetical protein